MTARVSKINGVTRLHTFEVAMDDFEWVGQQARACFEASTLGFKPGQFPDSFALRPFGEFVLSEIGKEGEHIYTCDRSHVLTILND